LAAAVIGSAPTKPIQIKAPIPLARSALRCETLMGI